LQTELSIYGIFYLILSWKPTALIVLKDWLDKYWNNADFKYIWKADLTKQKAVVKVFQ